MYKVDGRIRYSEIGYDGTLSLVGLVNYFQDCSTFHSEDVGLGIGTMAERKRAWILSSWQIVVERMPELGERVQVCTWPYEFKGFMGMRNYEMLDLEGHRLAVANSIWTLIDIENRTPVRITESEIGGYVIEDKAAMEYVPRKIKLVGDAQQQSPVIIGRERIDTNGHMNNGQYISLAAEYLPEQITVQQIRVEYKKEVKYLDVLTPVVYRQENRTVVELCKEEEICAIVEFI